MPKDRYCNYLEIFEWIENGTSLLVRLVRVQVCQTHWMGIDRISAFSAYGAADGFVTGLLYNIQVLNINIAFNWKRYHKDKELYFWFGHQNSTVKDDQHYHLKRLILILLRSLEVVQYERFTIHHHHHQPGKVFSANNTVPILNTAALLISHNSVPGIHTGSATPIIEKLYGLWNWNGSC